jgi:Cu-Zn family superoxide dismutase
VTALIATVSLTGYILSGSAKADQDPNKNSPLTYNKHDIANVKNSPWAGINKAVAIVQPTAGNQCKGSVWFIATEDNKVLVFADIEGLQPNSKHGFHIHEFGDLTAPDATTAGGHYNPEGNPHGIPPAHPRHAGSYGNIQADANGKAHFELTDDTISIAGLWHPIIGRAVIIHANPDDGTQPLGNAGPRIGCGVIGISKPDTTQPDNP